MDDQVPVRVKVVVSVGSEKVRGVAPPLKEVSFSRAFFAPRAALDAIIPYSEIELAQSIAECQGRAYAGPALSVEDVRRLALSAPVTGWLGKGGV